MNAFITSAPGGLTDPATALPTQIFIWADSPERGFVARTLVAILVLIGFLIIMNAIAIFLRQKLERKWYPLAQARHTARNRCRKRNTDYGPTTKPMWWSAAVRNRRGLSGEGRQASPSTWK